MAVVTTSPMRVCIATKLPQIYPFALERRRACIVEGSRGKCETFLTDGAVVLHRTKTTGGQTTLVLTGSPGRWTVVLTLQ